MMFVSQVLEVSVQIPGILGLLTKALFDLMNLCSNDQQGQQKGAQPPTDERMCEEAIHLDYIAKYHLRRNRGIFVIPWELCVWLSKNPLIDWFAICEL